jgi:hypothetical protein
MAQVQPSQKFTVESKTEPEYLQSVAKKSIVFVDVEESQSDRVFLAAILAQTLFPTLLTASVSILGQLSGPVKASPELQAFLQDQKVDTTTTIRIYTASRLQALEKVVLVATDNETKASLPLSDSAKNEVLSLGLKKLEVTSSTEVLQAAYDQIKAVIEALPDALSAAVTAQ